MASTFQQQARNRKLIYIGLVLVLFTAAWGWRRGVIDPLASKLAIREESRGDVELVGSAVRLSLMGSRGLVTCVLWGQAFEKQKLNQWNELEVIVRALTKLQPHFITPWLFQSWNLAYNVSVEADRPRDKYFYVTRGTELLAEGERQNRNHPDLRWHIGNYVAHKVAKSDETNYMRSLLQLSMIPPNERDPARFWKRVGEDTVLDYAEFAKFSANHPFLVRRLREGITRGAEFQRKQQFTCASPAEVVQFLEDNAKVPSLYQTPENLSVSGKSRAWDPNSTDKLLPELERFPVLPPAVDDPVRQGKTPFDREALTSPSPLRDYDDSYTIAHAWWAYAQEPLPDPGELPGHSKEIEDRARQRRPRNLTTLIFRNYAAQGRRGTAEVRMEEGWYDEEGWDLSDWFTSDPSLAGKTILVGKGTKWVQEAWARAYRAWREHGEQNHLMFLDANDEQNMIAAAAEFDRKFPGGRGAPPLHSMTERDRRGAHAAKWMKEYYFYRSVSNFQHHLTRAKGEMLPETVASRKMFHRAQMIKYAGKRSDRALKVYDTVIDAKMAKADPTLVPLVGYSPITAWRDLVLKRNKEFRQDSYNQENTAEIQLAYMRLHNEVIGQPVKAMLVKAAPLVPLLPPISHDVARWPVFDGPFEGLRDEDGREYLPDSVMQIVLNRQQLKSPRRTPTPAAPPPGNLATAPGKE